MSEENDILKIKSYDIDLNQEIGRGQFGTVFQCKDCSNPSLKLCAKIIKDKLDDPKTKREIELMKMIMTCAKGNKNIVGVEYVEFNDERIVLILEKCEYDLQFLIDKKKKQEKRNFTPIEALNVLKQVVNGYRVLYSNNIIHRDLKPANILVLEGVYKIADLGLARVLEANTDLTKVGTPKYVAPQLYLENYFSNQADIFSLGIITYELIFGGLPYVANNQMQIRKALRNLEKNPVKINKEHEGMTAEFAELIECMLKFKENERISWEQLFKHPLIQEGSNKIVNQSGLILDCPEDDDEEEEQSTTTNTQEPQKQQPEIPIPEQQQQQQQQQQQNPQKQNQTPQQFQQFQPQQQQFPQPTNQFQNKQPMFQQTTQFQQNKQFAPFVPPNSAIIQPQPISVPFQRLATSINSNSGSSVNPNIIHAANPQNPIAPNTAKFIHTNGQQIQQVQASSDQLFQLGILMDQTFELLEKYINIQYQFRHEYFGFKLYLHCLAQCFFEHSKALKIKNQQSIYSLQTVELEITKQNRIHQVLSQEITAYGLILQYPVNTIDADFVNYLQKLNKVGHVKDVFPYGSDKKFFLEYLQLLYSLERIKEITQTQCQDIYIQITDINKCLGQQQVMVEFLKNKLSK